MQYTMSNDNSKKTASFPIAIVVSLWNRQITQALQDGAVSQLLKCGVDQKDILVIEVPGAIEIPLTVKRLAAQKKVASIITLGSVIRGDTSHYDLVCDVVSHGCLRVSLDHDIPVLFGVLTTENEEQAWDRLGGKYGHKGIEVANCAIAMQDVLHQIS